MVREITIVKKPRDGVLQDKSISFPPLQNLHLDLMENKKKLKKNIPLVTKTTKPTKINISPYSSDLLAGISEKNKENFEPPKKKKKKSEGISDPKPKGSEDIPETPKKKKEEPKKEGPKTDDIEDDLAEDMGEDIEEVTKKEPKKEPEKDELEKDLGEDEKKEVEEQSPPQEEEDDPYAGLSPQEREIKEKEEYLWRFRILKKQYKNHNIPTFTEHDDLFLMKQTYERTLKELSMETNLESYRGYLQMGLMGIEMAGVYWMELKEFEGFYTSQMLIMDRYDRLLVELGEKSYTRWGSNLPVEIRLIGLMLFQAGAFYLGKTFFQNGNGIAAMFNMMAGHKNKEAPVAEEQAKEKPKKMRGPSVKVSDLKKKVSSES